MRMLKKALKQLVLCGYRMLALLLPVQKRTIVFCSNLGRNYTGSPRAVWEKMVELGLDKEYRCYYILDEPEAYANEVPGRITLVKNARFRFYYVMAVSGVWISDTRFQNYMKKRKQTVYIQTWHGTPLKKLGMDLTKLHMAGTETLEEYQEEFRKNSATWDYLISQNPFSTEVFRRAFDYHGKILPTGYPRNDVLLKAEPDRQAVIEKLRRRLGLPSDKRIMLYAPTWRDDAFYNKEAYRFATEMDFARMQSAFGGEYILLAKFHYMVKEKETFDRYPGFLYPVDARTDIAELYLLADILITDYSSVMFDYSILKRPMYFFAYDLEKYEQSLRGFYFDFLEEVPGPVVTTTEELVQAIQEKNGENYWQEYGIRYDAFCKKYNPYDDGHAAEKVIDIFYEKSM